MQHSHNTSTTLHSAYVTIIALFCNFFDLRLLAVAYFGGNMETSGIIGHANQIHIYTLARLAN